MSVIEGGRFDFDDGGSYVGEWCDGRAHGLGVATGPDNQGEFSGEWVMGFESRGIYVWPSGSIYAGGWMKGKRHGEGVQMKGKWVFKGEFTTGFCGRYGVKESLCSASKYEGSWHLNLFDGFGVETNADGSTYSGAWSKGIRQGLGVRKSAPYHKAATHKDPSSVRAATSQNSLLSANESERQASVSEDIRRPIDHRSGFVLIGTNNHNIVINENKEKKPSFRKSLFRKLRKQKSTGDLRSARMGGSLRSTLSSNSAVSQVTNHSLPESLGTQNQTITDPNVIEIYSGQWKEDKRSGYGVAERTDGLKYIGEWHNNKKNGYGVTHFSDGTKEEGRYKENNLVQALHKRHKIFALRHSRLKDSVEEAVKHALDASSDAKERAMETSNQRAQSARNSAETAETKAKEAHILSNHAREVAKEFAPDFLQIGVMLLKSRKNIDGKLAESSMFSNNFNILDNQKYVNQNYKPHPKDQLQPNLLNPFDPECLEVSGGSRRGSFRSSFRRSGEKPNTPELPNQRSTEKPLNDSHIHSNIIIQKVPPTPNNNECYSLEVPVIGHTMTETKSQTLSPSLTTEIPTHRTMTRGKGPSKLNSNVTNIQLLVPEKESFHLTNSRHEKCDEPPMTKKDFGRLSSEIEHHDLIIKETKPSFFEYYSKDNDASLCKSNDYDIEKYKENEGKVLDSKSVHQEERRRSVPSIMTSKPVLATSTKYPQKMDDETQNLDFLNSTMSVYIIENGIRKRVKTEDRNQNDIFSFSSESDSYHSSTRSPIEPEADELTPLPRNYKIEMSASPRNRLEGSLPDVSFCNEFKTKTGLLMSRQEASQLSQQRRQEMLREQERQRRGEIVIRMADIKDWFKQNYAIVLVLLLNCLVAVAFLHILKQ